MTNTSRWAGTLGSSGRIGRHPCLVEDGLAPVQPARLVVPRPSVLAAVVIRTARAIAVGIAVLLGLPRPHPYGTTAPELIRRSVEDFNRIGPLPCSQLPAGLSV